jgi:hypothetical protein
MASSSYPRAKKKLHIDINRGLRWLIEVGLGRSQLLLFHPSTSTSHILSVCSVYIRETLLIQPKQEGITSGFSHIRFTRITPGFSPHHSLPQTILEHSSSSLLAVSVASLSVQVEVEFPLKGL